MDPRYHGAPGFDSQDASRRKQQLPTSSRGQYGPPSGPPRPSGPPSYGGAPQYSQPGRPGMVPSPQAPGAVPAYPSGQYPTQYQPSGPASNQSSQAYSGLSGPASGPGSPGFGQQAYASQGYAQPGYGPPGYQGGMWQPPPGQGPQAGPSMASFMNPWNMISSVSQMGNNVQASQQYVSSRVHWFTGAFFGQLFQIDPDYVRRKLILLLAPFLSKYDYMRQAENMATPVPTMKPPRDDLFAPDLYVPLHAVFTYVVLSACNRFIAGTFKPEVMYNMFSWALMSWMVNFGLMFVLIRLMQLHAPPPALEIFSYAGYCFVGYCFSILMGWALGRRFGWYTAWLYTSCCMATFLIRTFKQVIRVDAAQRGRSVMYLLLTIGAAQYAMSWVMGATIHSPVIAKKVVDKTLPGT